MDTVYVSINSLVSYERTGIQMRALIVGLFC
jgi:hypothetical protein